MSNLGNSECARNTASRTADDTAVRCKRRCACGRASTCEAIRTVRTLSRASGNIEARTLLLRVERWLLAQTDLPAMAAE